MWHADPKPEPKPEHLRANVALVADFSTLHLEPSVFYIWFASPAFGIALPSCFSAREASLYGERAPEKLSRRIQQVLDNPNLILAYPLPFPAPPGTFRFEAGGDMLTREEMVEVLADEAPFELSRLEFLVANLLQRSGMLAPLGHPGPFPQVGFFAWTAWATERIEGNRHLRVGTTDAENTHLILQLRNTDRPLGEVAHAPEETSDDRIRKLIQQVTRTIPYSEKDKTAHDVGLPRKALDSEES